MKKLYILGIPIATCLSLIFIGCYLFLAVIFSLDTKLSEEIKVVLSFYTSLMVMYIVIMSSIIFIKRNIKTDIIAFYFMNLLAYGSFLITQVFLLIVILEFKLLFQSNGLELYLEFDRLWALLGVIFLEIICIILFILVFKRVKILYPILTISIIGIFCLPIAYGMEKKYYASMENGTITYKTAYGYDVKLVSNNDDLGQVTTLDKGWYYIFKPERTTVAITYPQKYNTIYNELNSISRYEAGGFIFYYDYNTTVELSKEWTNNVIFQFKKLTKEQVHSSLEKIYTDLSGQKTYNIFEIENGSILITYDNYNIYKYSRRENRGAQVKKWILKDGKYEMIEDEIDQKIGYGNEEIELLDKSFLLAPIT